MIPNYHVVSLDKFLEHGVGTCRHMALFAACMVERFINDGYLNGARVSVERNQINEDVHAWCRITFDDLHDPNTKEVLILDAAGDYLGPLNKGNQAEGGINWDYRRPEDKRLRSGGIRKNFGGLLRNVLRR
ncbi:MAG: hypothetical protein KatS3mg084_0362 [Candidatus Dojkabacteria bacterium]|nr:MAG: hypothetical protein KatS3mg084_0362 [Candidatus Dojkabacteria bacterium]